MRFLALLVLVGGCKKKDEGGDDLAGTSGVEAELAITSPAAGDWVPDGPLAVTGTASGLTDLKVNGESAMLAGGTFSTVIELSPGIGMMEVSGKDANGTLHIVRQSVIAGEFSDPSGPVEGGAAIRVNESGIDLLVDQVAGLMAGVDPNALLAGANPVYEDSYGAFGFDVVTIAADVTYVYFGLPVIDVDAEEGYLDLWVTLPDFYIEVLGYGDVAGWDFDSQVWLWADDVQIGGRLLLDTDGTGHLTADLKNPSITLVGFGYDTSLLPGAIEDYLFVDTIRTTLEDLLVEKVDEMVPPMIEEQLQSLDLSFETELLGKTVELGATFAEAWIDSDGVGLSADVDVHIPGDGGVTYAGVLSNPGPEPTLSTSSDVAVGLRDDLVNRILFEAWRAGMLNMAMSTDDGSLDPALLAQLKAENGTISMHAELPPVAVEREGVFVLEAGEMLVDIDTPKGGLGDHTELALAMSVGLGVEVEEGSLKLELAEPDLLLSVRETDWGRSGSTEAVTLLLEGSLPIDTLLLFVGSLDIPLPTVANIGIGSASVSRDEGAAAILVEAELAAP